MTPLEAYKLDLQQQDFKRDPAQAEAVAMLQQLYDDLVRPKTPQPNLLTRWFSRSLDPPPVKGLYLWGGVGRGKTHIVDQFYDCLPFSDKKRIHFHRFMHKVHERLKQLRHLQDPLATVASGFADDFRVLCFDEFIVNDITDAMILGGLLKHLFSSGVVLVATSNLAPDELYKDGLQRDRFQPAIDLLKEHTNVYHLGGDTDYRLQFLDKVETYFCPHDDSAMAGLDRNFRHVASDSGEGEVDLELDGREIRAVRHGSGVVWFDFTEICGGPRSQNDYLELARCFHTIIVSAIPLMPGDQDDHARRFINLVDIIYDRNVKFMGSGFGSPAELYQGTRLLKEFERTASRLEEMQSTGYLAKPHLP